MRHVSAVVLAVVHDPVPPIPEPLPLTSQYKVSARTVPPVSSRPRDNAIVPPVKICLRASSIVDFQHPELSRIFPPGNRISPISRHDSGPRLSITRSTPLFI